MDTVTIRLGRVVDILEASGAFDPGSNPGRGVCKSLTNSLLTKLFRELHAVFNNFRSYRKPIFIN